ncbi:MAG: hypothetical protein NE327_11210 [Lentisphaeraceae bacterium]|nr:hypothetical protein [Lentisphaeraceae bacterium]
MINSANIRESKEPKLCHKCDGIGSIWIYNKEEECKHCQGKGLEPVKKLAVFQKL